MVPQTGALCENSNRDFRQELAEWSRVLIAGLIANNNQEKDSNYIGVACARRSRHACVPAEAAFKGGAATLSCRPRAQDVGTSQSQGPVRWNWFRLVGTVPLAPCPEFHLETLTTLAAQSTTPTAIHPESRCHQRRRFHSACSRSEPTGNHWYVPYLGLWDRAMDIGDEIKMYRPIIHHSDPPPISGMTRFPSRFDRSVPTQGTVSRGWYPFDVPEILYPPEFNHYPPHLFSRVTCG